MGREEDHCENDCHSIIDFEEDLCHKREEVPKNVDYEHFLVIWLGEFIELKGDDSSQDFLIIYFVQWVVLLSINMVNESSNFEVVHADLHALFQFFFAYHGLEFVF